MKRAPIIALVAIVSAAVVGTAIAAPAGAQTHRPPTRQLLIIGASYTAGWGASSERDDYAHRLAAELGWPTRISAEPGAGYLSRGDDGRGSFLQQLAALPATPRPGVVLIQGGRDDIGQSPAAEAAAVKQTLAAIRAKFDDPRIVMVGDIPASVPVGRRAVAANELLARVAHAEHAQFIDPIRDHWISSADAQAFRSDVPDHPNDAGHAYIAERLRVDISQQ
jgi:lysophospholipase L1-like esterase